MAETRILGEHAFPDRLRLRVVQFGPCEHGSVAFAAVAGAQLGGLDTGREEVWRWCAFERLSPPFQGQLNECRASFGAGHPAYGRFVAAFGVPWAEVSAGVAEWQVEKLERMPRWLVSRMLAPEPYAARLGFTVDQLDRLRRSIVFEDVTEMQSAFAALRLYRERSVEWQPELDRG